MMRDALAPIKELKESKAGKEKARRKPRSETDEECSWCGRSWCSYLKGGEMCRAAQRSLDLLRSTPLKKNDTDGGDAPKEA